MPELAEAGRDSRNRVSCSLLLSPAPSYSRAQLPTKMTARPVACHRSPANLHKMAIYSARLAPTTSSEVHFPLSGNERLSRWWGEATPGLHSSACLAKPRLRGPF